VAGQVKVRRRTLPHRKESNALPLKAPPSAFYGLAGDIVRIIEPSSEADPVALLLQILVAFGNCAGRTAHFSVEADQHYPNLNAVMVGATSKARKGTSWGHVKRLFGTVDELWTSNSIQHGLSSGEGLIWAVRDSGSNDNGVDDKRLLVLESEFATVLRVMGRQGNVLSAVLRQAWDSGDLRILTRNDPARATGAHISVIGHITVEELRRNLTRTEVANGFANRFLWVDTNRSKCLPEGGRLDPDSFLSSISSLREALDYAQSTGEITRDDEAGRLWNSVYEDLSSGSPGLFGAVTSRAEAQVMRLALVYALLDQAKMIAIEHLRAALAVWRYCEASARRIFGASTGNKTADAIIEALKQADRSGITKTEITNFFNRNKSAEEIDSALQLLEEHRRIKSCSERSDGRTAMRYFLVEDYDYEFNEVSSHAEQNGHSQANEENELNEKSLTTVITPEMRRRLREYGETDEEIDAMKPAESRALLEYFASFNPVG
jgi:hypothetical protein